MARVRARRSRTRHDQLSRAELFGFFHDGEYPDREALYWEHRAQLWDVCVERGDGNRPEAFWQYEVRDPALWPELESDPRLVLMALDEEQPAEYHRQRAAEQHQAAERLRYLVRHELLAPSEREHIAQRALKRVSRPTPSGATGH